MGSLEARVKKLESADGGPCSVCGFDGDWGGVEIVTSFCESGTPDENEYCPECGRPLLVVVRWGDEP